MKRIALALVAALAFSTMTGSARAEPQGAEATAAQFFRAGLAAYERHEYRAAALAFEEAFRRAPRAAAMYNAGRGWEAAGDRARAADAFALALAQGDLEAGDATYARDHLAQLEPSLGVVDVGGPTTASVALDDTERGALPRKLHVAAGRHALRVKRLDGSVIENNVDVAAGSHVAVTIDDSPAPEASPPPLSPPPPSPEGPPERHGPSAWGYVGLGAAGVLAAVGAVTYVKFADDRSTFDNGGDHDASARSSAVSLRTATYVLWSAAGASAITGAIVLVATKRGEAPASALRVGPGWVAGSF